MNKYYIEEIELLCNSIDLNFLKGKSILISGASGLIGTYIVDVIMTYNKLFNSKIKLYAVARNKEKAIVRFKKYSKNSLFNFIEKDVALELEFNFNSEYIIHAASNANPEAFDKDPIGTIEANVNGTLNLLNYARSYGVNKFLYISSSEIYGEPITPNMIYDEKSMGLIDPLNLRSCYTESKRMAENICVNYKKQYNINTLIARIAFAYGPTFTEKDNRVIPQFIRRALKKEKIEMKSSGSLVRSYIYLYDVVSGIFKILSDGRVGEAYNIANKNSNISIRKIAETVSEISEVDIVYNLPNKEKDKGYAPFSSGLLDAKKLEDIGWKPIFDIKDGINQIIKGIGR